MNMKIMGIDASTSTVGISINENGNIIFASFIDISKLKTNKEKISHIINTFHDQLKLVEIINLESALNSFSFGFTSKKTILLLARFNGILEYVLNEKFPNSKINLVNVNKARKQLFGKCRIKGLKSKEFVLQELEKTIPYIHKFDIKNKKGFSDKRNSDIYDSIVLSLYK